MQNSNLAQCLGPVEDQPVLSGRPAIERRALPFVSRVRPRPRRPLVIRTIVIRDQGLRLFRCG